MKRKFFLTLVILFSVQFVLSTPAYAVTTIVDVSKVMSWNVVGLTATDVTYPNTVDFILEFNNNGTVDLNVSGNLSIKKDGSVIHNQKVFNDSVSAQQFNNFTFNWTPTDTGDFLANVTINMTSNEFNQSNFTFITTSFTVYSQPSQPPPDGGGAGPSRPPVLNITKTWNKILPGASVTIEIESEMFAFTEITIEVEKESNDVKVEVNRFHDKPSFVSKEPAGRTYQYIEIKHDNLEGKVRNVVIMFRVENEWLSSNSIDKYSVTLNRYSDDLGWESFTTGLIDEDSDYAYYGAEIPDLSVFSITGRGITLCRPGEKRCYGDYLQECSSQGSWDTLGKCDHGCYEGGCITEVPPFCSPGERRCSGNVLQRCKMDGTAWKDIETCKYGCWDNECKGMYVSYITRMAVFVLFAILVAIVVIMMVLVYMNVKMFVGRKR
ncbi:MAG: PGF-pre-PGF domain-containing protein [Candidatus Aenigmarchaeota archaeon]|nr:PGF-pre-PGF domain-containing protein [Candidatus Aenigmarchaeota archaeon]NIQ18030.1 PGF-pre-PGF domain-containing protein [Candidatus Aenigmarchaeota archaeon]